MNIAAYCRVSTDKSDQLNSLEAQKKFFTEFTERNGHNLVKLYADEGISGTKIKNRKEFLKLMRDAKQGLFEMVVVKDISRFARNTVDFLQSIRALKSLGIETTFLTANMTVLGNSEFVLTIFGALAQEESANTSKRVKFGKKMNAEKGRVPNIVYGYDKTIGDYFNLGINKAEAEIVRQIYAWYLNEGFGAAKIANKLNERGVKTKRGCAWSQNAVCRILTNELYTGKIINGKEEVEDFLTGVRTVKDESEWMVTDRPDLRIIEPEQFDRVQEILKSRHKAFHIKHERQSNRHLFSTLIKCKECGWSFRRTVRTYKNTYIRWVCSGHNGRGAESCPNAVTVDEEELINALDEYFADLLKNKQSIIKRVVREFNKVYKQKEDNEQYEQELMEELGKLKKTRQKYMDMYTDDLITREELNEKIGGMKQQIEKLENDLKLIEYNLNKGDQLEEIIQRTFKNINSITSVRDMNNEQLKQIIQKIEVDKDGNVDIYLRLFGDLGLDETVLISDDHTDGQDGSLSAEGTFALNSGGHGADIGNDTVFTLTVPAGQTTVSFGICAYGSSMAAVKANGQIIAEDLPLNGALEDGAETSVRYTSDEEAVITVEVTGNGYLHHISAETITPPRTAAVSGSVSAASGSGDSADGQTLLFTDEAGSEVEAVISEDTYSVALPVGHVYTVSFENSDVYEVTDGNTVDLTDAENGDEAVNDITYRMIWDLSKDFHFTIGDTVFTVSPGASSSADFTVTAEGGDGRTELATPETAIIWADLEGGGLGTLMQDTLKDVSENVSYTIEGNIITFTYNDADTSPLSYTVQVKDNSASGNPHANGRTITYDFGDGSIVSELYTGNYSITGGDSVSSSDALVTLTGNNRIRYNGSHGIMIGNGDQVSVKVAGNAEIVMELCAYTADGSMLNAEVTDGNGTVSPESVSAKAASDGNTEVFSYTGEPSTLTFTYEGSGSGYLHTMTVTNEMEETEVNPQDAMPEIKNFGAPDSMTASAAGQRLTLTQTGGSLPTGGALSENVGYYGFDLTADRNRLEADVTVNSCGSSSSKGVFFGAFDGTNIETAAIRNTTNLRGVYSDETGEIGAGRMNETIAAGSTVHFTAERTKDRLTITAVPETGQRFVMLSSDSDALFAENGEDTEISFGFILADASVTVTNMKYYNADGTLLYDQNDCYEPIGTKPVVSSVQAAAADTRDGINVIWNSREPADGDGRYVIQVRKDGGEWKDAAETTATSWLYRTDEAGQYQFRVGGKLGNEGEVTYCDELSEIVDFLPALPAPVLSLTAGGTSIDLSWTDSEGATAYEVYRYSSDEGADNPQLIYKTETVSSTSYTDTGVIPEVPYYYYVIAYAYADGQTVNSSNPSQTVWGMASAGHTGDFVYEDEAAVITVTDCPQGTIFRETAVLAGTVDRAGVVRASVNGETASEQAVNAGGNFRFSLTAAEGRNNAELIFTDENGKATRLVYTFVYLTNYDMVVDASYTGEDGAPVNGLPTYSTVQAAVDAVSQDNAERQVIYIKSGDYKERLVVNTPYISLIGEDRDSVRIHCYPAELYPEDAGYEAGGDMSKRCAAYIMSGATGFSAENLTFANDYDYSTPDGKSNKSADALRCDADGASFVNVTISGVQDTLYMHAGNQYYRNCRIEGLIDFIYSGDDARALFEECELVFVYEETHPEGGYVCAPRTAADASYGLIFNNCVITSEEGCVDGTYRLARPWGPDACIYWIGCYMGSAIDRDEPYADMSGNLHTEARFYECGSYGPGYAVNADRRQISPSAAAALLAGLGWNPYETSQTISESYIGDIVTEVPEEPVTPPAEDPSQEPSDPSGEGSGTGTEVRPGENETEGSGGSGGQKSEELEAAAPADTGDHTNIALWSAALILAGTAGTAAAVMRRRGRRSR